MINHNPLDETRDFQTNSQDDISMSTVQRELADVFDRYAMALDRGDQEAAEAILAEYPEIGDEYREPLRGLYLLGRVAQQQPLVSDDAVATDGVDGSERKRLGDFEIEFELGRGGMGIVYAAQQFSLQRRVALKVLPFTAVLDPRQVARFRNEAQAAASLHHANIVPVYGVGCERGVHYYSMQLIEGQSLEQFVQQLKSKFDSLDAAKPGPCSEAQTAGPLSTVVSIQSRNYIQSITEIGAQVADALHYAHEQAIVHRDIKPSNLLLDQTGKIWVADFGLAQCQGSANLTSQGDRLGTARYMSPEQAAGRTHQIDFHTDVYSLGATLYELLSLRPAFGEKDRVPLMAAIESKQPAALRSVNPAIPIDLETVISKAMAKEPTDRYQSAEQFADDLNRCLKGEPILAKRRTAIDRAGKAIVRHKWLVAGSAMAMLVVAVTATILATEFFNQHQDAVAANEKARFYLAQAHDAVNRFGSVLVDELELIPGTDKLQARLVTDAIGYYDDFLNYADELPDLQFEKAMALSQLAVLYQQAGRDDQALRSYETAIQEFSALASLDDNALFEKAVCLDRMGLLRKHRGEYLQATEAWNESLSIFETLQPATRQRTEVIAADAQTRANLGRLASEQGELAIASTQFENALKRLQSQPTELLIDPQLRSAWFKINSNYVAVLNQLDPTRAESTLRKSMEALDQANRHLPDRERELREENSAHIADMQNNLAVILCRQAEYGSATKFAQHAVKFWQDQMELRPGDSLIAQSLATVLNTLGEVAFRSESDGIGDNYFAKAESLLRRVVSQLPDRTAPLSSLATVLHNRSLVAQREQNDLRAVQLIRSAIEFQTSAANTAPGNANYNNLLKSHQQALNEFLRTNPKLVSRQSAVAKPNQ